MPPSELQRWTRLRGALLFLFTGLLSALSAAAIESGRDSATSPVRAIDPFDYVAPVESQCLVEDAPVGWTGELCSSLSSVTATATEVESVIVGSGTADASISAHPTTTTSESSKVVSVTGYTLPPPVSRPLSPTTATTSSLVSSPAASSHTVDVLPSSDTTLPLSSSKPAEAVPPSKTIPKVASAEDTESPDDDPDAAQFLSFDEWKAQNLVKAGQPPNLPDRQPRERKLSAQGPDQALDAIGDEMEIDLGSGDYGVEQRIESSRKDAPTYGKEVKTEGSRGYRSEAGKTSKERFNYASFDCAATVLKTNGDAKGSSAILVENKDRYMLNKCSADNKFVIVELCDDILVDTVVLANFEFFSSMFKDVRFSVSDRYPVKESGWHKLGVFEAANSRIVQAFRIDNPLIWARYLRIEFLSHYGSEYYCPLSLVRVHGTTMMEEYKHQEDELREKDEGEGDEDEAVEERTESIKVVEAVQPRCQTETATTTVTKTIETDAAMPKPLESVKGESGLEEGSPSPSSSEASLSAGHVETVTSSRDQRHVLPETVSEHVEAEQPLTAHSQSDATESSSQQEKPTIAHEAHYRPSPSEKIQQDLQPLIEQQAHRPVPAPAPPPAGPTTQESIYKQITKRLALLEANATLSLQYIEEQSRMLRDVFGKTEKKQAARLAKMFDQLNNTLSMQLDVLKLQYTQLAQATVHELDSHRSSTEHEVSEVNTRLSLLASEVIFQKRMSIAQSTLLLATLIFIFTTRGAPYEISRFPPLRGLRRLHTSPPDTSEQESRPTSPTTPNVDRERSPLDFATPPRTEHQKKRRSLSTVGKNRRGVSEPSSPSRSRHRRAFSEHRPRPANPLIMRSAKQESRPASPSPLSGLPQVLADSDEEEEVDEGAWEDGSELDVDEGMLDEVPSVTASQMNGYLTPDEEEDDRRH
ncbi:hypothetical protein G7K_3468-t1 [Saitoella complicata NRRL Y-17804]|uniref:SUN domain-containing protein n=1 Tax=Saitoella complicata (strain BCRC 22490 / CBS 7301 / JCM 7358 / NBRC 10748 / NRRL Y-17804) TaxID=698492 RepID=A0A0E9NHG0_SAICN|nr:hypothetical protein G7K_3468-t1 [Saitoella complicata NRRL Y-17804]